MNFEGLGWVVVRGIGHLIMSCGGLW